MDLVVNILNKMLFYDNISALFSILCFLLFVIVIWFCNRKRKFTIFQSCGIPGPKPNFWIGNLKEFVEKRNKCVEEYVRKYGSIVGCFIGMKPFVFVTDPDLLKIIQVKEFTKFNNRDSIVPDAGVPLDFILKSVPMAKDDDWKKTRFILNPIFISSKIKKMIPIFHGVIDIFLEKIEEKAKENELFDIYLLFKNLTMDAITKSSFGFDTDVQHGKNSLVLDSAALCFQADSKNILMFLSVCFPELEPIPTKLRKLIDCIKYQLNRASAKKLLTVINEMIITRKCSTQKKNDLLQHLIDKRIENKKMLSVNFEDLGTSEDTDVLETDMKKTEVDINTSNKNKVGLSDDVISINLLLFLIAGFDTSSSAMGYFIYLVSNHPNVQEKIRKEINDCVKKECEIQYDDLKNFIYLSQVIAETLRLHPVSELSINRISNEWFKYKNIIIPKGAIVSVPVGMLHRNPDYWPDPDKFIPERFSAENKSKINPILYQPFGYGQRNCIGMRYAQSLLTLTLARLLRAYKIEANSNNNDINECPTHYSLFINHPKEVIVKVVPV